MATRREQLSAAKRRQRLKDKQAGQALYQVKLPVACRDRLKTGMRSAGFVERLCAFLEHELVEVRRYPSLALLCWSGNVEYITRRDAFQLYERNWRLLEAEGMAEHEQALLRELKLEFGKGLINA